MLILGRNVGEYVVIGDNIVVKVVKMRGDLKLAIEAPKDVNIVRGEVYEQTHPAPMSVRTSVHEQE